MTMSMFYVIFFMRTLYSAPTEVVQKAKTLSELQDLTDNII
jgi:hypothetical protein